MDATAANAGHIDAVEPQGDEPNDGGSVDAARNTFTAAQPRRSGTAVEAATITSEARAASMPNTA